MLGELLEPIMGKGLIPADPATWSVRRRQIVPAFHKVRTDIDRCDLLSSTSVTDSSKITLELQRRG